MLDKGSSITHVYVVSADRDKQATVLYCNVYYFSLKYIPGVSACSIHYKIMRFFSDSVFV